MEDLGNSTKYRALLFHCSGIKNSQLMVLIHWPRCENNSPALAAPSRDGCSTWIAEAEVSAAPLTSRKAVRLFGWNILEKQQRAGGAQRSVRQGQLCIPCDTQGQWGNAASPASGCVCHRGRAQPVLPGSMSDGSSLRGAH